MDCVIGVMWLEIVNISIRQTEFWRDVCKIDVKCNIASRYCVTFPYSVFGIVREWRDYKVLAKINTAPTPIAEHY